MIYPWMRNNNRSSVQSPHCFLPLFALVNLVAVQSFWIFSIAASFFTKCESDSLSNVLQNVTVGMQKDALIGERDGDNLVISPVCCGVVKCSTWY